MWTARLRLIGPGGAALAVLFSLLSGCGSRSEYPPNYAFPSRTDRLVLLPPTTAPASLGEPGQIEKEVAGLDALGGKTVDPASAPAETRAAIDQFLKDSFGTPAEPRVAIANAPGIADAAERLTLTAERLSEGGKLFRRHCDKCHNTTGNGRGPTGLWLSPYPRDFRQGYFKFTTVVGSGRPRRSDLMHTLDAGLKGTAMPSFSLLPERERDLLTGYVIYLALRGQVEFDTFAAVLTTGASDVAGTSASRLKTLVAEWEAAQSAAAMPVPPDDGEPGSPSHAGAVKRGHDLFTRKADNACVTCHVEYGRKPLLRYDIWGTVSRPADLTVTALKGGTRPEDIFARIRAGIPAVGMPPHPDLSDRQIWDLVRFVKSAPYQRELPREVLRAIYPDAGGQP